MTGPEKKPKMKCGHRRQLNGERNVLLALKQRRSKTPRQPSVTLTWVLLDPTVEDAAAELLLHFVVLDIMHETEKSVQFTQSEMQTTFSETADEKKQRHHDEKQVRKQNKELGHSEMVLACSQNSNGSS
jgi:hypothetical protein